MRLLIALSAVAVALAAAGAAQAGGWASVSVDPLPTGIEEDETWRTEITVLQHGQTPLNGLEPVLTIREATTGLSREFRAAPTEKAGVYETGVVFPEAGQWNVVVESGWWGEGRLTFGPVTIGDGTGIGAIPESFPVAPVAAIVLAIVLVVAATFVARRRWGPTPVR
jgi:hypothetical protein